MEEESNGQNMYDVIHEMLVGAIDASSGSGDRLDGALAIPQQGETILVLPDGRIYAIQTKRARVEVIA